MSEKVETKVYKGMPSVELTEESDMTPEIDLNDEMSEKGTEATPEGSISISIESLDLDLQHNQSYGVISASTGCISNPGGPSC